MMSSVPPLRIAVVAACPFPLARGTPVRILRMAEALADLGHDVHVVAYHLGAADIPVKVPVHRSRTVSFYNKLGPGPAYTKLLVVDPLLVGKMRQVMREVKFDVIHAHHYEGLMVAAAANVGKRVPIVYDAHTLLMTELPYYPLGLPAGAKLRIAKWMDAAVPKLASHTVCVTDTIRRKLVNDAGMKPELVSVAMNGVEYEHFADGVAKAAARRNGRTCMFTGNLAEYQGIDPMLRAFAKALARVPDARLVIASDSSFAEYEARAKELGIRQALDVIPSPPFSELPALLAKADACLNPRVEGDGVGVKMLNYMAAGRPVVNFSSFAPGVVHLESGWLAAPGNIDEFAEGIVAVLTQPELARKLGEGAQAFIRDNCRWQIVAERCETLYRDLIRMREAA